MYFCPCLAHYIFCFLSPSFILSTLYLPKFVFPLQFATICPLHVTLHLLANTSSPFPSHPPSFPLHLPLPFCLLPCPSSLIASVYLSFISPRCSSHVSLPLSPSLHHSHPLSFPPHLPPSHSHSIPPSAFFHFLLYQSLSLLNPLSSMLPHFPVSLLLSLSPTLSFPLSLPPPLPPSLPPSLPA